MLSHEINARKLVRVLVQYGGLTSEDLRKQFAIDTGLVLQSFYNALKYCKTQGWLVGGGRGELYTLSPDGSWREPIPSIRETLEKEALDKDRLEYLAVSRAQQVEELQGEVERLRDWSNGSDADGAGVAISSLVQIVANSDSTMHQRIRAAETILGYKTDDAVTVFVRKFLGSVCASTDTATDHRIAASELLRKSEAPRVTPESVRPAYGNAETGATRTEAWRTYDRWQLKKQIVLETRAPPQPGWDTHLQADTYVAPEGNSMPPVRVVTDPASGFRLLDNLLPKTAYRIGNSSNDDK